MPEFTHASKQHPCPLCRGDHACSHAADGLHFCRRRHGEEEMGWVYLGEAHEGGTAARAGTWPQGWDGSEACGDELVAEVLLDDLLAWPARAWLPVSVGAPSAPPRCGGPGSRRPASPAVRPGPRGCAAQS
jgi:hypothetical protein